MCTHTLGGGQWYNMEHRCRQRPAHSDLCNFFDRAGSKLSLSFSHTHLHTNSHTKIARRAWTGPSPPFLSCLLATSNLRPIYLIPIFFIPSPPLHSLYQLPSPRQYVPKNAFSFCSIPQTASPSLSLHLPPKLSEPQLPPHPLISKPRVPTKSIFFLSPLISFSSSPSLVLLYLHLDLLIYLSFTNNSKTDGYT